MTATFWLLLAFMMPWSAGDSLWRVLRPDTDTPGRNAVSIGAGYLVGMVLWGVLLRFMPSDLPLPSALSSGVIALLLPIAALIGALGWRMRGARVAPASRARVPLRVVDVIVLGMLALFALGIVLQAFALPTMSWDAWNVWMGKAKGWYFAGAFVPTLVPPLWIAAVAANADAPSAVAVYAVNYPDALPRLSTWIAAAAGRWNESAVHLLWPGAWAALGLALFGYQRGAGVPFRQALLVAAFVLTMPLIVAHAALAGYADLWLAAMLLLAVAQAERWHRSRRGLDAAAALLAAALLPALKQEGAVWLACFAAAGVMALLPRRWRWIALCAGIALWVASLPFGGLRLPLPGLGWVRLGWGAAEVPGMGTLVLFWRPVLWPVFDALLLKQNWSLLWYAAPCVLWLARRGVLRPSLGALGWFFGFGFGFQMVLFFFTDASQWAENLTSLNRVLLQIVPAWVLWLSLLWNARAGRDTPRPSVH